MVWPLLPGEDEEMDTRRPRILVIDDAELVREQLRQLLQAEGYICMAAVSGRAGLMLAQEAQPDLILLDLMLPDLNGYEVCRQLKASPLTRRIPVIFLTVLAHAIDRIRGLSPLVVDYIAKPIDGRDLLARVDQALRARRASAGVAEGEARHQGDGGLDLLPDRRWLEQRLADELANPLCAGIAAACLVVQADQLPAIERTYGRFARNLVLRQLAQVLRSRTRAGDIMVRYDAERFAVLLLGVPRRGASIVGEKLRSAVHGERFTVVGYPVTVTVSIGLAYCALGPDVRALDLLDTAEQALAIAARSGNRIVELELAAPERSVPGAPDERVAPS